MFFFVSTASELNNSGAARLAGFSIYISRSANWWNGHLCFKDTSTTPLQTNNETHFFCTSPTEGQYVTIYNDRNSTVKPAHYSATAILELCEVKVEGKP